MSDSLLTNALGSATAGIIGRICTHPLDTAKARIQAVYPTGESSSNKSTRRYRGTLDVLQKTFRSEGLTGLYRGFGAVIVGGTPGTVLYLCSYDIAKKALSDASSYPNEPSNEFLIHFACGMIAETLACIIYVPVDVTKERMQVQHKEVGNRPAGLVYKNSWDAFKKISSTEGLSGIYKGYAATLGSFGPFSAFYFVFYERFKHWSRLRLTGEAKTTSMRDLEQVEIPFPWLIACSSSAGALASWITSPLDMAKLRLQVQRGSLAGNSSQPTIVYRGVFDCLKKSFLEGGFAGLFRGAGTRVIYTVPATTVTMTAYEQARYVISKFR